MTLLELREITKSYNSAAGAAPIEILRGISLAIETGDSLAVLGPSGSGKSTLLNIMGGLDRPDVGEVILDGMNLAELDDDGLAAIRNAAIGFVFQFHHLLPQCTALENVLVPALVNSDRAARAGAAKRGRALLDRVGLGERMNHRPDQLSGGECQRVAVVRALINQPKLVLADEPTGSLDAESSEELANMLVDLNREDGVTLVVVTHSEALAARMKRTYTLRAGVLEPGEAR